MPVVLTFNRISEFRPAHQEEVVLLTNGSIKETIAENIWIEYDDGWATGNVFQFDDDLLNIPANCSLETVFGSKLAQDDDLWMGVKEFKMALNSK